MCKYTLPFTQRCKEAFLNKAPFSSVYGVNVCRLSCPNRPNAVWFKNVRSNSLKHLLKLRIGRFTGCDVQFFFQLKRGCRRRYLAGLLLFCCFNWGRDLNENCLETPVWIHAAFTQKQLSVDIVLISSQLNQYFHRIFQRPKTISHQKEEKSPMLFETKHNSLEETLPPLIIFWLFCSQIRAFFIKFPSPPLTEGAASLFTLVFISTSELSWVATLSG